MLAVYYTGYSMNKTLFNQKRLIKELLELRGVEQEIIDVVLESQEICYQEGRIDELRQEHSYAEDLDERLVDAEDRGVPTLATKE